MSVLKCSFTGAPLHEARLGSPLRTGGGGPPAAPPTGVYHLVGSNGQVNTAYGIGDPNWPGTGSEPAVVEPPGIGLPPAFVDGDLYEHHMTDAAGDISAISHSGWVPALGPPGDGYLLINRDARIVNKNFGVYQYENWIKQRGSMILALGAGFYGVAAQYQIPYEPDGFEWSLDATTVPTSYSALVGPCAGSYAPSGTVALATSTYDSGLGSWTYSDGQLAAFVFWFGAHPADFVWG